MVRFCEEKNKVVSRITRLKLYLKADLDELEKGIYIDGKDQVSMFWQRLVRRAKNEDMKFKVNLSNDTCPWCRIFLHCKRCTYGKRNGICRSAGSRYRRIRARGITSISKRTIVRVDGLNTISSWWLTTKTDKFNSMDSNWYRRTILKIDCDSYQVFWSSAALWE